MRLLIITQYFPPEMGAPQARLYELAQRLAAMGHEITILTAMPNYPTGKIFGGYRYRLGKRENLDGLRVVRTCLYPSKSRRTLPRLFSYVTFGLSSLLLGTPRLGRHDVVLIESPPLFLVPFALAIARMVRGKTVMMVSDIWPDILIRMGHASPQSLTTRAMLGLESWAYRHSHAVALTNPGACQQIKERFPHLERVTVISNGVDANWFRPELASDQVRRSLGAGPDDFLAGYCGLYGLAQGLEVIIDAADKLRNQPRIKFIMMGDGPTKEELLRRAEQLNLPNLRFFDRRPKDQMPALLASLDVSLVPLAGRFPGTMPSKVYEALASGAVPIVAKGCEGDTLVTEFNAGASFEPLDGHELADAVSKLASDQDHYQQVRSNALQLAPRFDRAKIAQQTAAVLEAIHLNRPLPDVSW